MTEQQQAQAREMIRHAIGLDYKDKPFRNRYCAVVWGENWELMKLCVLEKLLVPGDTLNDDKHQLFHVTEKGKLFADQELEEA